MSRAPRVRRERWLQVLDGMRRQRAAYVRVPTAPCELDFVGLPFVMSGGGNEQAPRHGSARADARHFTVSFAKRLHRLDVGLGWTGGRGVARIVHSFQPHNKYPGFSRGGECSIVHELSRAVGRLSGRCLRYLLKDETVVVFILPFCASCCLSEAKLKNQAPTPPTPPEASLPATRIAPAFEKKNRRGDQ